MGNEGNSIFRLLIIHFLVSAFVYKKIFDVGFIIVIWPIGYIVGQITDPFRKQLGDEEVTKGLEKAGMWIGCIERTIIYIFVLSNFLTAIAFLVTAKSIFRFGEISKSGNRKEAEYILIGTLMD